MTIPFDNFAPDEAAVKSRNETIVTAISPHRTMGSFFSRHPRITKTLEGVLIACFASLISCEFWMVRKSVIQSAIAVPPPIEFENPWHTDKESYAPGEIIRFKYIRRTTFSKEETGPMLATCMDAFENKTTGEVFGGSILGRVIQEAGVAERTQVKRIPIEATDGEYVFEGWMRTETLRRSAPTPFQSNKFIVKVR
jgi:hypothetical protein